MHFLVLWTGTVFWTDIHYIVSYCTANTISYTVNMLVPYILHDDRNTIQYIPDKHQFYRTICIRDST